MRLPPFRPMELDARIENAMAVRLGLREGYLRRLILDHGVDPWRIVIHSDGTREWIAVDKVCAARIELRWEGYVGSWWHAWCYYRPSPREMQV